MHLESVQIRWVFTSYTVYMYESFTSKEYGSLNESKNSYSTNCSWMRSPFFEDKSDLLGDMEEDESDLLGGMEEDKSDLLGGMEEDEAEPLEREEDGDKAMPRIDN